MAFRPAYRPQHVLPALRISALSRLGAALVALSLTGAPVLAARPEHASEHRCQCRAHGREHACACPICAAAAARARRGAALAEVEKLPPCHREAARAAVAPAGDAEPARRQPPGPCLTGSCGLPDEARPPFAGLERFPPPPDPAPIGQLPPSGEVDRTSGAPRQVPRLPETPPPRTA